MRVHEEVVLLELESSVVRSKFVRQRGVKIVSGRLRTALIVVANVLVFWFPCCRPYPRLALPFQSCQGLG